MVFKDLEGTKQARKELAEKELKILQSLQIGKPPKPKPTQYEMITYGFEDYKQFQDLFKDDHVNAIDADIELLAAAMPLPKAYKPNEMTHLKALLEAELEDDEDPPHIPALGFNSPAFLAFEKKMNKLHKRKLLKSLIEKHSTQPNPDLSLVDNYLSDEDVDDMIMICLKIENGDYEM